MKSKYYVFTAKRGSTDKKKLFFDTYAQAKSFVKAHSPDGDTKGIYHIYSVDPVYYSKPEGRISFGTGNKEWEKRQRKK